MGRFLPSSWNEWGGSRLTHTASESQGAGASESRGHPSEAARTMGSFVSSWFLFSRVPNPVATCALQIKPPHFPVAFSCGFRQF